MALKLYVWEGVLESYGPGVIVAFAENEDEARLCVVRKQYANSLGRIPAYSEDAYRQWLANRRPPDDSNPVWDDMQGKPDVYEVPVAFIQWGSD